MFTHVIMKGNHMNTPSRFRGPRYAYDNPVMVDVTKLSKAQRKEDAKFACRKAQKLAREVGVLGGTSASATLQAGDRKWIVDSGSCFDIVNTSEM